MQPKQQPVALLQEQTLLRDPGLSPSGFTAVPNWLFTDCTDLSLQAKWTFSLLLHYSWQDGQCFPGIETLAANLGATRFSVMRWIGELKNYGLLSVTRRGLGQTNVYSLLDRKARLSTPDVAPVQHQEVTPVQHQEVAQAQHVDVAPMPHNKDTVVTKTQTTKTQGDLVPPVDISTKVDNSARGARAREAPAQECLTKEDIAPDTSWLMPLARSIHVRWGGGATNDDVQTWCDPLLTYLGNCTSRERDTFVEYLFSNDVMKRTSSPRGVRTVLGQDAARWLSQGKPSSKIAVMTPAPKVPVHIQREHDRAYKPPRYSPESIARHLATIRKYKGEECAQRWLAENGLTETGT